MNNDLIVITMETIGWIGAGLLLLAFVMTAVLDRWESTGRKSLIVNTCGSAGIVICSGFQHSWQSMSVNVAWLLFSLCALLFPGLVRSLRVERNPGR